MTWFYFFSICWVVLINHSVCGVPTVQLQRQILCFIDQINRHEYLLYTVFAFQMTSNQLNSVKVLLIQFFFPRLFKVYNIRKTSTQKVYCIFKFKIKQNQKKAIIVSECIMQISQVFFSFHRCLPISPYGWWFLICATLWLDSTPKRRRGSEVWWKVNQIGSKEIERSSLMNSGMSFSMPWTNI